MNKKMREILANMETKRKSAAELLEAKELEKAGGIIAELEGLQKEFEISEKLFNMEKTTSPMPPEATETQEGANAVRAIIKRFSGQSLTETEKALLLPTTGTPSGASGEGYILPQDISTIIQKKIREYKSLRSVLGYMPTSALSGSFPVEDFETVSELVDFTDGDTGTDSADIKFSNVKFALTEKAAFIKLSNSLLSMTDNALISYVAEVFARKAVMTENKMGFDKLKNGKTVVPLATWNELKSAINKKLDPGSLYNTVIVTNQTGFDFLDKQVDTNGKPILQPDVTEQAKYRFAGYPVEVFSDALLPSTPATATKPEKTPIFFGNLREGAKFVDTGSIAFATSSEAGFMSNTTVARLIEFVDVVKCDNSDKCYVYAEFDTASKTGA